MLLREYLPVLFLLMNAKLTGDLQEKQGGLGVKCQTPCRESSSRSMRTLPSSTTRPTASSYTKSGDT